MKSTSCLQLFLPVFVAGSVFGQIYESFRPRLIYRIIPLSLDVQDGRPSCNITDVFPEFDASVCELPLSDLKTINESDQRRITTMCFGVYDSLYEICSRVNRTVENVLYGDLPQSYNLSNFCVEMGETHLVPIRHEKSILNKWAEYLTNQFVSTKLCEDFCQSHDGKVHIMCKIIQAGHQYLNITSNGEYKMRRAHSISLTSENWDQPVVHSIINETVNEKLNKTKQSEIVEGKHSIPLTSENWDQSEVHSSINETVNDEILKTTKQSQIVEGTESSTKRSIGRHGGLEVKGISGWSLWLAVLSVVLLLNVIVGIARFIGSKFQRNERLFSTRPSSSYIEMSEMRNERKDT